MQLLQEKGLRPAFQKERKELLNTESTSGQASRHKDLYSGIKNDLREVESWEEEVGFLVRGKTNGISLSEIAYSLSSFFSLLLVNEIFAFFFQLTALVQKLSPHWKWNM